MRKENVAALALALALSLPAAAGAADPPLYRVRNAAGHTLYVLGTMHVGAEGDAALNEAVEAAWQSTSALAAEVDLAAFSQDRARAVSYSRALLYADGDTADHHLSPETYALGVAQLGLPEATLRRMRPAAWLSQAQSLAYEALGLESQWGMDAVLLNRAHQEGRPVYELETVEAQTALMQTMPDAAAEAQLHALLAEKDASRAELLALYAAWETGDAETIAALSQAEAERIPADAQADYEAYARRLYDERNQAFAQAALDYLSAGECVLMAVGAAHLPGKEGVVRLLENAGCQAERINP